MHPFIDAWSIESEEAVTLAFSVINNLVSYPGLSDAALLEACGHGSQELRSCLEALRARSIG